jgi:DNA-directed RNA polymerase subunit K
MTKCEYLSQISHIQEEQEDVTTLERYTRYERARIIGARALQISLGAPVLIRPDTGDPIDIALRELEEGVLPITVKR